MTEAITQTESPRLVTNIHQRILAIMSELDYIEKGSNKVNGQYRFVSHDQVTAKVHPLLVKHGVTVIPSVEEMTQDGNRTTVKMIISFVNVDCPSDNFNIRYVGHGIDSGDKGPGKAVSYACKYALLKTFCLETGEDPDNDANAAYEPAKCREFDILLDQTEWSGAKEKAKVNKFLEERAKALDTHIEAIKWEAIKRMPEFLAAVEKWTKQKKEEK